MYVAGVREWEGNRRGTRGKISWTGNGTRSFGQAGACNPRRSKSAAPASFSKVSHRRTAIKSNQAVAESGALCTFAQHLDHDPIRLNRIMISFLCLSMIFSENRCPLFRIML